jgi:non-ribosomal peptide synthetase component F
MLDILLEDGLPKSMTDVGVGGAAVPSDLCLRVLAALPENGVVYTGYSGTEVGDVTAIKMRTAEEVNCFTTEQGFMTAGRSHSGQRCAILDEAFSPVGPDAIGEVCVAGPGLASGYLNLPEKTEETFLKSVRALGDTRAARSGDLAAWRNDSLQIVGRRDAMVKVRGARVELGEVETAVLSHPDVKTAVITVYED